MFKSKFHNMPRKLSPRPGSGSPWGKVDSIEILAPGIVFASTASHGGIHLTADRLADLPDAARSTDGWYEEDCEAYIVYYFFFEELHPLVNTPVSVIKSILRKHIPSVIV